MVRCPEEGLHQSSDRRLDGRRELCLTQARHAGGVGVFVLGLALYPLER